MHLTFGWWNTGLSPTKKPDRASARELETASVVLRTLLEHVETDFLALGEVSKNDIEKLQDLIRGQLADYTICPTQEKVIPSLSGPKLA